MRGIAGNYKSVPPAVLVLIIIAATFTRSTELGPSSLWTDDAWVALAIKEPWSNIWHTSLTSIGFRALIRVMLETFGNTSFVAQLLPYVFGILTIPMTYIVARQLKITPWFALFAAFMVASSRTLGDYSVRVKQYTGDALFTLIVVSSLIILLQAPARLSRWLLFAFLCCLSIVYSGQLLIVIAPAVAFVLFYCGLYERAYLSRAVFLATVTGLFSLGWYFIVLRPAIHPGLVDFWSRDYILIDQGLMTFLQTFGIRIGSIFNDGFGNNAVHIAGGLILTLTALYLRSRLALCLLLPVFLAIALAMAGKAPIGARTDAYFLPLVALVMALGAESVLQYASQFREKHHNPTGRRATLLLTVLFLAIFLAWDLPERYWPDEYPQQDVRTLTAVRDREEMPGDCTLLYSGAVNAFRLYTSEPMIFVDDGSRSRGNFASESIQMLPSHLRSRPAGYADYLQTAGIGSYQRVWLLTAQTWKGDVPVLKEAILSAGFREEKVWSTPGDAELSLYARISGPR